MINDKHMPAEPYPGTSCLACRHYNRAVLEAGTIDLAHEAVWLQLWLHTGVVNGGVGGEGSLVFDIGSQAHYLMCRMIEGARQLSRNRQNFDTSPGSVENVDKARMIEQAAAALYHATDGDHRLDEQRDALRRLLDLPG